ncbi:hypothetical protein [Calothrix sp. UHCC 0171]|uniref:hypothetical protein n=1 Tax=Calothrix sp. UHCC 0171 TaxID=3110245 RepID=UPI002B207ECC|nr:hypothetical protein [Calothrix sp. UHCC 0171]MEA5570249.1 hypothetical protein [Calothrix sp. UHCC 0171]
MSKRRSQKLPILTTIKAQLKAQIGNGCLKSGWLLSIITIFFTAPVLADAAHFGTISLSPGFNPNATSISGYTGGAYSLSAITNRDINNKACLGFADPTPDHIIILEQDFSQLKVLVNSGGTDTTLLIQAPDNTIYCGDDTGMNKDASINLKSLQAGKYKVWVGTFNANVKQNYTLNLQ